MQINKTTNVILTIIALALIVIVVFLFINKKSAVPTVSDQTANTLSPLPQTKTPTATNIIPPVNQPSVSTANWTMYANTGCGYSFKYPDSWSHGDESSVVNLQGTVMSRMIDFIDATSQGIERTDGNNNQISAPKDSMHIECYTMGTSIYNDALSRYNNSLDIFAQNKKTITVGGQTAIVGEVKNTATISGGAHPGHMVIPSRNLYVFFMHKDQTHALYFEFNTPLGNDDSIEVAGFEQVLKTFKFAN
jgi:hypothetical protein